MNDTGREADNGKCNERNSMSGHVSVGVRGSFGDRWAEVYRIEALAEITNAEVGSPAAAAAHDSMVELTIRQAITATRQAANTYWLVDPRRWRCAIRVRRYERELTGTRWQGLGCKT